jgi:hypothetical protein
VSAVKREPYRQVLPALDLSLERFTENVPADGRWRLLQAGQEIGCFRSLKAGQEAWREFVRASGWRPTRSEVDVADVRRREQAERWSRNRGG